MASCSLFAPRAFPLISRRELETLIIFQRLAIGVGSCHNITITTSLVWFKFTRDESSSKLHVKNINFNYEDQQFNKCSFLG